MISDTVAGDLGYGDIGILGQKIIKTPNIDKLASDGMIFTNHYSGAPVSGPSRCILMTGKHSGHSSIRGNIIIVDGGHSHSGNTFTSLGNGIWRANAEHISNNRIIILKK